MYTQPEEHITLLESHLYKIEDHLEVFSAKRDQLRVANASLVGKLIVSVSMLQFYKLELLSWVSRLKLHVTLAECASALCERDQYKFLIQSVAA